MAEYRAFLEAAGADIVAGWQADADADDDGGTDGEADEGAGEGPGELPVTGGGLALIAMIALAVASAGRRAAR